MSNGEIWHDVCVDCRPEMDIAICGTKIAPDHKSSEDVEGEEMDGQNCVVCMSMECPTCPESEGDDDKVIIGRPV